MAALIPAGISAAGSIIAAMLSRKDKSETSMQKKQRELVDQLLGSLNGQGPFSNLFSANEADFEKSFAAPARQRFQSRTVPQIQQGYIAEGQQRGTGLQDELARAGVDMDQLINEHYLNYQQGAQNRQAGAINAILGAGAGPANQQSLGSAASEGAAGYLSGEGFGSDISNILKSFSGRNQDQNKNSLMDTFVAKREGFENDPYVYNPYTGIQE